VQARGVDVPTAQHVDQRGAHADRGVGTPRGPLDHSPRQCVLRDQVEIGPAGGDGERVDRALAEAGIPLSSTESVADHRFRLSDHMQQVLSPAQLAQLRNGEEAGDIIGALRGIRRI